MNTYILCKKVIENTEYKNQEQKDEMQFKLDVFLLNNRISQNEYNELSQLLIDKSIEQQDKKCAIDWSLKIANKCSYFTWSGLHDMIQFKQAEKLGVATQLDVSPEASPA